MIRPLLLAAITLALAGCTREDGLRPYAVVRRADVWQAVITDPDRGRLSRLAQAWEQARADIADAGASAQLAALGAVAEDKVMAEPVFPAAGPHQCRIVRLGWRQGSRHGDTPVQVSAWGPCTIRADGILLQLETAPGPQQFVGTLYPDVERLAFLGTVRLAGDMGHLRYGEDAERDQLGVLQPLAPGHWRIALPWPRWTARLVLIELR